MYLVYVSSYLTGSIVPMQIATIEAAVLGGQMLSDSDFIGPTDLLMCQLIKLDASEVDGDAKVQKRILVRNTPLYL